MIVMGIDIGTQGARAVACTTDGCVLAAHNVGFDALNIAQNAAFREQHAPDWWAAARQAIGVVVSRLKSEGFGADAIKAISIDGTSGTVLPVDAGGTPLTNALMYNDRRAGKEAAAIGAVASTLEQKLGYKFNASFALPKILWLKSHMPHIFDSAAAFIHQADYIVGCLTGEYRVSDYSNALKTGYDLIDSTWPDFLGSLGLDAAKLPRVEAPGRVIARVNTKAAEETGLAAGTPVAAGASDGYASALAAGTVNPGDWATIIGTTMVLKGVTTQLVHDNKGRIYSHRHPQGYWMPGGASNIGGRCLTERFGASRFDELNRCVAAYTPTGIAVYPLTGTGERFPFLNADALYFESRLPKNDAELYTAMMEGVSYAERLSFDMLAGLGCDMKDEIFTAGGACKSDAWLQMRASVLGKRIKVPQETDAAMGAALLAATAAEGVTLGVASRHMITIKKRVEPDMTMKARYDDGYQHFISELKKRGYIDA
jgi:xylulokinase